MLIISMLSVLGIYLLGKEIFNKKVGLIASFLMSIFYLNLFFTYRLLVDLPSLTFFIFSAFFFYKYIKTKKNSNLYWFALMIGIGTLFKLSTAFLLVACLIFLLFTEGFSFLKKKEMWISALIFWLVLLPYIIFGYYEFGGFVLTQASAHVAPESYLNGFNLMWGYIKLFPTYFSSIFLMLFVVGLIYFVYRPMLYFNKLKENNEIRGLLYTLLLLIIPFILISFFVNHIENRYIITCFTPIFIISGFALNFLLEKSLKEKNKIYVGAFILFVLILGSFSYHQLTSADALIKNKLNSYEVVKESGLWLKEYSEIYGIGVVATKSQPQIKYYSGLNTINLPSTEEEFEELITNETKYFMLSIYETHPEWSYNYPNKNNLTAIQAYLTEDNQPLLVIYELK